MLFCKVSDVAQLWTPGNVLDNYRPLSYGRHYIDYIRPPCRRLAIRPHNLCHKLADLMSGEASSPGLTPKACGEFHSSFGRFAYSEVATCGEVFCFSLSLSLSVYIYIIYIYIYIYIIYIHIYRHMLQMATWRGKQGLELQFLPDVDKLRVWLD